MHNLRKTISKFKADFQEVSLSNDYSTNTIRLRTDDDLPKRSTSLTKSTISREDLPAIPVESVDDLGGNETVSSLPKRSLIQSLQGNTSLVSTNDSLSSTDSSPSNRTQTDSQNNPFVARTSLPHDPKSKEFTTRVSGILSNLRKEPQNVNGAHYDIVNDSSTTTTGNVVSRTPMAESLPSDGSVGPMESIQPTVKQTFQPSNDPTIQTTPPTVINGNSDQRTSEMTKRLGPTPSTQTFLTPVTLLEREFPLNPFSERENSVPGDFPLDEPSTSSSSQSTPIKSPTKTSFDNNPTSTKVPPRRRPSMSGMSSFLLAMAVPPAVPEKTEQTKTPWRPAFRPLQPIGESSDSSTPNDQPPFASDKTMARKMEELGRIRRMQARNQLGQPSASPDVTSQRPPQSNQTSATLKPEVRPQLQTLQENSSSDMVALLRDAYAERQQALQTQLDKALAELRDMQAENKRLTTENQSQQRSISKLETALQEAKHAQSQSMVQTKSQLLTATSSLMTLNKEKKGWQDKLDSMQHKLSAAERQVRCLDYLTRHKLESRQEAAYGQPKRRGLFSSTPASTDIIGAMRNLNEEIYQACVQLVDGLERTSTHSDKHKWYSKTVLGDHLTAMMEDQSKRKMSDGYNMLLMQTVLEVFMTHWCSSIIEAFYPKQESFADLLVQLSAQNATIYTGPTAICGKQIQIVQPSTPLSDIVKFNDWVKDIIKELGLLLMIAGVRMKTQRSSIFSTKTLALVKAAYDLRTAMAEKDICGGLEVLVVTPATPFQETSMTDAHADPKAKSVVDHSQVDFVTGMNGIGLQRKMSEKVDGQFQSRTDVVLKPKVVLARALNVKD